MKKIIATLVGIVTLVVLSFCQTAFAGSLELIVVPTTDYTVRFMPGVALTDGGTATLSAIIGPIARLNVKGTTIADIGVLDIGVGDTQPADGNGLASHLGIGLCTFASHICGSGVYDFVPGTGNTEFRVNITADLATMIRGTWK